jgi:two-component system, chemotaxis family, sensor kinase CheA
MVRGPHAYNMAENDPYKYFRIEARELLESLTQGLLEMEKGASHKDLIGRMLRHAHTLKGAARIVNQPRISELSHDLEDLLAPHREGGTALAPEDINTLLRLVDAMAAGLRGLEPAAPRAEPAPGAPLPPTIDEPFETVRIEISAMDLFLHEAAQARIQVRALKQESATVDQALRLVAALGAPAGSRAAGAARSGRALPVAEELRGLLQQHAQSMVAAAERAERELERLQDRAADLRLLPASMVFAALERTARDAAGALDKRVEFCASGGENRLDAHVLGALRDALAHVVRNAVAHGIETEAERRAAGKPAQGRIELRVQRRANRVVFSCHDDGRGIDVEQVRRAALAQGLISPAQALALGREAAIELLLRGGVTTMRTVTQMSGRGVGLDVVRETVARLKGEVTATTETGHGTTVSIAAPVSLESLTVLEVDAGGAAVSIPLDAVVGSLRIGQRDLARSPAGDALVYDGQTVPFVPLVRLLRPGAGPLSQPRFWTVVVLQAESRLVALGVDHLRGRVNVVLRPLPRLAGRIDLLAGASFDSAGNPQPVIDPAGVVRGVLGQVGAGVESAVPRKLPILVIDDSLTTRMLEQSILQTAGYEVDLAVSGEEGLQKSRQRRYAIFVVDVEMPGIDGFEFIAQVQADPQLREVPCILVTSRASAEDRRRGEQAGARAYMIKSEFDEGQLLKTISSLMG